jgi:REP element-mobilizing transposase RayT
MKYDPGAHRRRTIRLWGYDYSQSGMYFITICTEDCKCLFGNIVDGKMCLNDTGQAAGQCWSAIPSHFPYVTLGEFVVMPNHIHGIIALGEKHLSCNVSFDDAVGAKNFSPLRGTSRTIGSIVRGFKIGVTKWARSNTSVREIWQRNYWEHIIRGEAELMNIREYIRNNPARWMLDKLYRPSHAGAAERAKNLSPLPQSRQI